MGESTSNAGTNVEIVSRQLILHPQQRPQCPHRHQPHRYGQESMMEKNARRAGVLKSQTYMHANPWRRVMVTHTSNTTLIQTNVPPSVLAIRPLMGSLSGVFIGKTSMPLHP